MTVSLVGPLCQFSVAVLVLLARAAGARVVAPDLLRVAHRGLDLLLGGRFGERDVTIGQGAFFVWRQGVYATRFGAYGPYVFDMQLVIRLDVFLRPNLHRGERLD